MYKNSIYGKMSSGENMVSDFLKSVGVYWIYESPVFVTDDQNRPRLWTPDFYLPAFGFYIEVMGPNGNYDYRKTVYELNSIPVVFIDPYKNEYWGHDIKKAMWDIHTDRYQLIKDVTDRFRELQGISKLGI